MYISDELSKKTHWVLDEIVHKYSTIVVADLESNCFQLSLGFLSTVIVVYKLK